MKNGETDRADTDAGHGTPAAPEPVLEIDRARIAAWRDEALVVIEEVNWSVRRQECWVVAGLHRSGKSDLLAVATGLNRPQSGEVRLFGQLLTPAREEELIEMRKRVGLMFRAGQLLHHLTIEENVALPVCYHLEISYREASERIAPLLEALNLSEVNAARPPSVSVAVAGRAALARALALQPELLLLDNPLTGLDPREIRWWLETLDGLAAGHPYLDGRPVTLVVTTDDLRYWRGRTCRLAVLKDRRFATFDSLEALPARPDALAEEFLFD